MSSYQDIKGHIFSNIRRQDEVNIKTEINNTKEAIEAIGIERFSQIISANNLQKLTEADWQRMQQELETQFNVKMEQGILITGEYLQQRDTTWWTGKAQKKCNAYYWDRYKNYLNDTLPPEIVETIAEDTDVIMNNIENPDINQFDRRGMVVGHVQSGKTGNYAGLICKAADAGYKFIVVIAGGIDNLRNQTQERLNRAFIGKEGGRQVGVGVGNAENDKLPISLTTKEADFNKPDADRNIQSTNFDTNTTPIILVIKKNVNTLKNVSTWLDQYPNKIANHAMLVIDDESDYASIDTSKTDDEPTAINKGIRTILAKFTKSIYIAYTATPYANIFIDHKTEHEEYEYDLFPRDFIYALNFPTNYFGAREIFLDSNRKYLLAIDDYQDIIPPYHKKDSNLSSIPYSLCDAIQVFLLNIAIRHLRGQANEHNSMLIHATRFTAIHKKLKFYVGEYLEKIKQEIKVYGKLPNANKQSNLIQDLENILNLRHQDIEFTWEEILSSLCNIINTIVCREVHQQTKVPLEYRNDVPTNAIVIGGTSLSRGYTLEGLSVSYFLRNTIFYDTLMQMGRWFGYREGYQDLCRIYMPENIINNFGRIIEATEDLFDDFKRMRDEGMTPNDFGLAVKQHPDSVLQVTARNKQRATKDFYFDVKLDGQSKETVYLYSDENKRNKNISVIKDIINKLSNKHKFEKKGSTYLWSDIDKIEITKFLDEFEVFYDPYGIEKTRMPIDFVKRYTEEHDICWDIALYSGEGEKYNFTKQVLIKKPKRKITNKGDYYELQNRQLSSESAELVTLSEQQKAGLTNKRKDARAIMLKPLLMLYIIQTEEIAELAAFGISFPGGVKSKGRTVKVKINSVLIQDIKRKIQSEQNDD